MTPKRSSTCSHRKDGSWYKDWANHKGLHPGFICKHDDRHKAKFKPISLSRMERRQCWVQERPALPIASCRIHNSGLDVKLQTGGSRPFQPPGPLLPSAPNFPWFFFYNRNGTK